MDGINYKEDPRAVLCHFNEKHDSNGRFAKKSGGAASSIKKTRLDVSEGERKIARLWAKDEFTNKIGIEPKDINTLMGSGYATGYTDVHAFAAEAVKNGLDASVKALAKYYVTESSAYSAYRDGTYHSEQEYLTGSGLLANTIYDDIYTMASDSPYVKQYLDSPAGQKAIGEAIGEALGIAYATQKADDPITALKKKSREKNRSSLSSKPHKVEKRSSLTRETIKKQNPDLPATAVDEMYKAMQKENKSMRGGSSMPSSTVKHEISYKGDPRAVLCHYNPNHDPKTGQFTSKRFGSGKRYGEMNSDPSFGMGKYIHIDENGKKVLTEAGRARWEHDKKRNDQKKKEDRVKDPNSLIDPHRWVKEDLDAFQQGLQNAQNMAKSLSDFEKKKLAQRPLVRKKKLDLSEMTDQDLNNQINRYVLEQRYLDIFNPKEPPEVSKGKKWLMNTLEVAGGALAVGASAVTIAKAVHDMKKGA